MNNSIKLLTKVLIIDNYDSFTYNLLHQLQDAGATVEIKKNDEIKLKEVEEFDRILLSPGPGLPSEAGIMPELIKEFSSSKSILGVCLGHQALGEAYGAKLKNLKNVFHGVALPVLFENEEPLFKNIKNPMTAGRYHSWSIDEEAFPDHLAIIARDQFNNIMAIKHKHLRLYGVQFHPESIMTPFGSEIINNWLKMD